MQCPRCSTRWRVGDSPATENPVFKCGRCHHVFPQFPGAPPAAERSAGKARGGTPPEPDNLEFIFPQRDEPRDDAPPFELVDGVAALHDIVLPDEPPAAAAPVTPPRKAKPAPLPEPAPLVLVNTPAAEPSVPSGPEIVPIDPEEPAAEPIFDLSEDPTDEDLSLADADGIGDLGRAAFPALDVEAMMGASSRTSAFQPATRLLFSLVMIFAVLALLVRANPARTAAWLGRLPVLGSVLTAEPRLGTRITLDNVQGGYQRLRTGRRVFVISGKATNNALVPVERIEVEGSLYAASGSVEHKVISTGNKTTLKLRDLSESEIALLQNLDARQPIAPGARTEFAIVFLEPPRDLREFSSRVLTARSTGRGPVQPARAQGPPSVG
ncbi:MAG TPA: DUF3426 domain-containing protein [Candidatus Binatia bacterium]